MFCPVNFRTLIDLADVCREAGHAKANELGATNVYYEFSKSEGQIDWKRDLFFIAEIWANFFFNRYLLHSGTKYFVCSPKGEVLRVSSEINYLEWDVAREQEHLKAPKPSSEVLQELDQEMIREADFHPDTNIEELKWYYLNLEKTREMLFVDRKTSIIREPRIFLSGKFASNWNIFSAFSGWSICFEESGFSDCLEELRYLDWKQKEAEPPTSKGRPRKIEKASRIYWIVFPDGHKNAGETWKSAAQKVSQEMPDDSVSPDTLKRAVTQ